MRISDWSSDVCSSDLTACRGLACGGQHEPQRTAEMPVARVAQANAAAARCVQDGRVHYCGLNPMPTYKAPLRDVRFLMNEVFDYPAHYAALSNGKDADPARSEERSVGKEGVSTCRSRGVPQLLKNKKNKKP